MSFRPEFSEISILIPGYSVEDLPTDLAEAEASSLWNAIACAWHPRLLAQASSLPMLRQAESQYGYPGRRIILVPTPSESWMPHEWRNVFRDQEHVILDACTDRAQWLAAIDAATPAPVLIDPSDPVQPLPAHPICVPDFLAFGTVTLQLQLLSRRRHHFIDPDQILLARELRAAATAAILHDEPATKQHLAAAFDHLREIREQIYPQKCVLLDLCLPGEQDPPELIASTLNSSTPVNLLISGHELRQLAQSSPAAADLLRAACESAQLCFLSGHEIETRTSLGSMAALRNDLIHCRQTFLEILGHPPRHWARRRFGLIASLPAVLHLSGFESALHVALDDGLYPDRERSQFDWQAPDGSIIPAASRIPLAIDSAAGFQKFADRFNESMQEDPVAALFLARLPQLRNPWLDDLKTASGWAPVLGEFVTLETLTRTAEGSRLAESHDHSEYVSPALIQASVLKSEPPVSGPATLHNLQQLIENLHSLTAISAIIRTNTTSANPSARLHELQRQLFDLELLHLDINSTVPSKLPTLENTANSIRNATRQLGLELAEALSQRIPTTDSAANSLLLLNPLPFPRTLPLQWPTGWQPPAADPAIEAAEIKQQNSRLLVQVPPGGFLWLRESSSADPPQPATQPARREPPLAEPLLLRNKHFEVRLNDRTGGIQAVTFHGQRGNRVSQQPGFRFERELSIPAEPSADPRKTHWATPRLVHTSVLESGPVFAAVETITEFSSPADNAPLGRTRQITRVDRLRPVIEIEIELTDLALPVRGNPWLTGWCCRFAWDNEAAVVSRAVLGQIAGFRLERIESPDFIEITDGPQRLTILSDGRPWHRRSGNRMLDSLLQVEGEHNTCFRFRLDFDQPSPLRSAEDLASPLITLEVPRKIPARASSAWILGLSARNVQLVQARWIRQAPNAPDELSLILSETEGLPTICQIRTARPPVTACLVNHDRSHKVLLETHGDSTPSVPLQPFQIREVLLTF
ncbi:MAG: hypothetical protein ACKO2P_03720 [Planctomycetota bacterium]